MSHFSGVEQNLRFNSIMIPIVAAVFCSYMTIGIALGILPVYIHNTLNYGDFAIGFIVGLQFIATLATRSIAGRSIDVKGTRKSYDIGTIIALGAGLLYSCAGFMTSPLTSCSFLILARMLSGFSESFQITGGMTWAIGLLGAGKSGKVMAWNGIAMYGGIVVGASTGIYLLEHVGVRMAFLSIIFLPVIGWLCMRRLPALPPQVSLRPKMSYLKVVKLVCRQGLGLSFSALGFGCISSFISLLFQHNGWGHASMAFLLFGGGYIGVRLFFASLPDKIGGNKIAFLSLIIEAAGQLLLWQASASWVALVGALLSGVGFSLVFPALGVEAMRKVNAEIRGSALGAYVAFFDVSLSITGPLAGLIASRFSYSAVYFLGMLGCLVAGLLIFSSMMKNQHVKK